MLSTIKIVLVETTHPGNIGAVARAMKNMKMHNLWLVSPKIFPSADATSRASGADDVLAGATVCQTLQEAVADCQLVIGASARGRTISWPEIT
ncbi:MAG: TrmH family RNA methyltransferase, partial [Methylobacter sp.]